MNTRHYLSGELNGILSAHRRGYVAAIRYDNDLAMDWYGICCEEGMPFVQCALRSKYHVIDYDLEPFLRVRPDLGGLTDVAMLQLCNMASSAVKASPSHVARHRLGRRSGMIESIPRAEAHQLARRIGHFLRDVARYERRAS